VERTVRGERMARLRDYRDSGKVYKNGKSAIKYGKSERMTKNGTSEKKKSNSEKKW
jgi:hypothetical protein